MIGAPTAAGLLALSQASAAISLPASYAPRALSAADAQSDVALMRRALDMVHPGLYRRTPKRRMDRAFARLEAAVARPLDELAFYRDVSRLLAEIRCNHTKAEQTDAFQKWRDNNPSHLPFRFRLLQGRMIVVSAAPESGLARGTEVLAIDGRPIARLVRALGPYVPIDGETTWTRAEKLADDSDLMGADFDHFYPYVYGQSRDFVLSVRDAGAARPRFLTVPALSFRQWLRLDNDGRAYFGNFSETTTWRMLDQACGYLQVETFVNYRRPVDAQALFTRALDELRASGATRLVVDLRANGGGSDDASLALLDHLTAKPYTYQRAIRLKAIRYGDLANHIETWGDRDALFSPPLEHFTETPEGWFERRAEHHPAVLKERPPAAASFKGPVTLLIGPANASGATMLIAKLRDMGRVRLVGGRSGGSADGPTAGQIFNLKLPNSGVKVRIPIAFNQMDVARFDPEGGVRPDLLVEETVADFLAGRDRALEAASAA